MKYFAQGILLALIALLPISAFADQLEVIFPPPPALDVNGLPAQVLSWDVYVNGALREEGVPLSVSSRTYEITEFRQYSVQVAAINSVGVGALSAAATVDYNEPRGVPSRSGAPGVRILMIGGGGGGGEPPVEPPSGDPYDMSGFSIPFSYSWPTEPNTTNGPVSVSTIADLQTYASAGGYAITVNAGTYVGSLTIASDTDIIVSNSATIEGTITFSGNRTRWTGGNHRGGNLTSGSVSDILIDNLNSLNENNETNNFSNFNERLAIINTTLSAIGTAGGNGWLFYTDSQSDNEGLIFANVKFATPPGRQTHRINRVTNYIAVDTYFNVGDVGSNSHRSHVNTNTIYMDNCIIGNGWLASADPNGGNSQYLYGMGNGTLRNMNIYSGLSAFIVGADISNVTISDSTLHSGAGAGTPGYGGLTDGGGNSRVAWDETSSGMPDGVGAGADH